MAIDLADVAAGTGGFVIHGAEAGDGSGFSVSSAGDVNGDGFDDLIIGALFGDGPGDRRLGGDTYVVFGKASGFAAEIDLAAVAIGIGGFVIHGEQAGDESGWSVSSAGDVNGDGFDDLLISAPYADGSGDTRETAGDTYVVFGHGGGFAAEIDLAVMAADGGGGFVLRGEDAGDFSHSVSPAGDINGDGFADLIIGSTNASGPANTRMHAGGSYVVFGAVGGFAPEIDLTAVAAGTGGFVIHGEEADDSAGTVSSAGDVNGDGFDDLIIGAPGADGPSNTRDSAGASYLVFGHAGTFAAEIDLAAIAAGAGVVIDGQEAGDYSGYSVSSAGDINGDGFADILTGARGADGPDNTRGGAGDSYVVFGHVGDFPAEIDLAAVATGTGGFVIHGEDVDDGSGGSVSSAGDINGDGFDDLIIGALLADGPGNTRDIAGDTYVVFGHGGAFAAEIDLAAIAAGAGGFVIHGQEAGDYSGFSASSAGDINGDGFYDLIIGAFRADGPNGTRNYAGDSYVLFGSATVGGSANHVTRAGGDGNNTLTGTAGADDMVGGRGNDVLLGDGGRDVLIGGQGNDTLTIGSANFARVVGGTGDDVLAFLGAITLGDAAFRKVSGIESIKLGNNATKLTLGAIASHAIDGLADNDFAITVDGSLATNAAVTISADALSRALNINLAGDAAAVSLTGGSGDDHFISGSGADTLTGGSGSNVLDGGAGVDMASYRDKTVTVAVTLNGATSATVIVGGDSEDTIKNLENVTGGTAGDKLTGDGLANVLNGIGGNDMLRGEDGDDTLNGGAGVDRLRGGAGLDRLDGGAANDSFIYTALTDSGTISATRDQIGGFASGDKIDVHLIDAITGGTDDPFVLDDDANFVAGEIRQTVTPLGNLRLDFNVDEGDTPEMSILLVNYATLLADTDFRL